MSEARATAYASPTWLFTVERVVNHDLDEPGSGWIVALRLCLFQEEVRDGARFDAVLAQRGVIPVCFDQVLQESQAEN